MRIFTLESTTEVPRPLEEVFAFHAEADNLQALTPPWLDFRIVTPPPIEMRRGTRIVYRLRVRGIPVGWTSEITAWEPPHRFVDEQVRGPYRLWVHEHVFTGSGSRTVIRDRVRYAVLFGGLVHWWLVGPDLRRIFTFRHARLLERFGGDPGQAARVVLRAG